ncbi:MAG: hypothetical protein KJ017_06625 [Alphaproteobacteria bacterium]|nr:hypothetical protein [Alphaproteobacteria bacterium]
MTEALEKLLVADFDLLEHDANERSISHRLAVYLESYFPGWNVDCEYNRDGHEPKRLSLQVDASVNLDDSHAKTVYPDIIVHKRGTDQNLLVIEIKKSSNPESDGKKDKEKLKAYKSELGYKHAVFILINVGGDPHYECPIFIDSA